MKKLLSILALLFFSANTFCQSKLKPVVVIVEQHNGNSGDFYLVLNGKQIGKTYHLEDEILNVYYDTVYCPNGISGFNVVIKEIPKPLFKPIKNYADTIVLIADLLSEENKIQINKLFPQKLKKRYYGKIKSYNSPAFVVAVDSAVLLQRKSDKIKQAKRISNK